MTENKRFTDIEHDYENARIKCKDDGLFMLYAIYEDDDGLPTLGDLLNGLSEENEQLKQENSVFEGKDAKHYQRWVNQIKKYVEEDNPDFTYDDDFIIKIALSYTLQSVRNGESLKRFQWYYKELNEND